MSALCAAVSKHCDLEAFTKALQAIILGSESTEEHPPDRIDHEVRMRALALYMVIAYGKLDPDAPSISRTVS